MILLDTNICIAALKNDRRVQSRLPRHQGHIYLPFIVSVELWFGLEKAQRSGKDVANARMRVEEFHEHIDGVLYADERTLHEYASLRATLEISGKPVGPNNTWIAALALTEDAVLVSANTREFSRIPELRLENWLR